MGVRDFGGLERGGSPLWISNHPRYHGSAWKVPARNIEPSTISWFSVESPARNIEPSTISRFSVEGHALDIEPSTISWFSVESHRSEYRTIHDFTVQRGRSPLWILNHPRYRGSAWKVPALEAVTKRAERANGGTRAACFEQPEGVHSGCGDARPAMFTSCYSIYIHP